MHPKILLVDDREDNLMSIEVILSPAEYQFFKARSGTEALKILLSETDFALILMDVKMPILNGFETADLIHEREILKGIPIIFITANNYGDENIYKGYQSGGIDYILKPINPEILRSKVAIFANLYEKNRLLMDKEQKLKSINEILGSELNDRKASEGKFKKQNEELIDKVSGLESTLRDLRRFTLVSAHDFHDPLKEIEEITMALQANLDKDLVVRLRHEVDRIQSAFLNILAFSRISIGEFKFMSCDLNHVVNDLLRDMEQELKVENAKVFIAPLPTLQVIPELMRSLFQGLISHALSLRHENVDPIIKIRPQAASDLNGQESTSNKGYHSIVVEDNCSVISSVNGNDTFTLFRSPKQKSRSNNGEFDSAGICLALCRKIAEMHNGSITAHKNDQGNTFIISLPEASA